MRGLLFFDQRRLIRRPFGLIGIQKKMAQGGIADHVVIRLQGSRDDFHIQLARCFETDHFKAGPFE